MKRESTREAVTVNTREGKQLHSLLSPQVTKGRGKSGEKESKKKSVPPVLLQFVSEVYAAAVHTPQMEYDTANTLSSFRRRRRNA